MGLKSIFTREHNAKHLKVTTEHVSFVDSRMTIKWFAFFILIQMSCCLQTCPEECSCGLDIKGRIQTICIKGGMKTIPIKSLDPNVEVLIIRGPRNFLTLSPAFVPFTKLEVLRITESNVPSIGTHSFWGVQSLRILGEYHRE